MPHHAVVTLKERLEARQGLLDKEKELTRLRDTINAERIALPWVKVEKNYVFETPKERRRLPHFLTAAGSSLFITSCLARAGRLAVPHALY